MTFPCFPPAASWAGLMVLRSTARCPPAPLWLLCVSARGPSSPTGGVLEVGSFKFTPISILWLSGKYLVNKNVLRGRHGSPIRDAYAHGLCHGGCSADAPLPQHGRHTKWWEQGLSYSKAKAGIKIWSPPGAKGKLCCVARDHIWACEGKSPHRKGLCGQTTSAVQTTEVLFHLSPQSPALQCHPKGAHCVICPFLLLPLLAVSYVRLRRFLYLFTLWGDNNNVARQRKLKWGL